jgi:SMODS-associating 4TM effector domain
MNTIAKDQNSAPFQRLLKARQRIYSEATRFQITQLIATVLLPVTGAVLGTLYSPARPWVALYGLIVTVLDVLWIDRSQREKLKVAAKLGDQFDCAVLKMSWNVFAVGKTVDAETVDAASRKWSGKEAHVLDWYAGIPERAPLHLARIVCQRTNLWYDSSLRRRYGKLLIVAVVIVLLGLIIGAAVRNLTVIDLVSVAATISPAIIWAIREQFRQSDAAESIENLKGEAEKLLEQAKGGLCGDGECERRSREFQDAIYGRRVANPLILPLIYKFLRPEMEKRMEAGVNSLLEEYAEPKA